MEWYSNKKVGIFFDATPQVGVRYALPSMDKDMISKINKYPFINKRTLKVELKDYTKKPQISYFFEIPKGYCYDGATIPRFFWRVIGASSDNRFLIPALIHDVLCENHHYINDDRKFSTEVFNALLECNNIGKFKRMLMKHSVNFYQMFCHW